MQNPFCIIPPDLITAEGISFSDTKHKRQKANFPTISLHDIVKRYHVVPAIIIGVYTTYEEEETKINCRIYNDTIYIYKATISYSFDFRNLQKPVDDEVLDH